MGYLRNSFSIKPPCPNSAAATFAPVAIAARAWAINRPIPAMKGCSAVRGFRRVLVRNHIDVRAGSQHVLAMATAVVCVQHKSLPANCRILFPRVRRPVVLRVSVLSKKNSFQTPHAWSWSWSLIVSILCLGALVGSASAASAALVPLPPDSYRPVLLFTARDGL